MVQLVKEPMLSLQLLRVTAPVVQVQSLALQLPLSWLRAQPRKKKKFYIFCYVRLPMGEGGNMVLNSQQQSYNLPFKKKTLINLFCSLPNTYLI